MSSRLATMKFMQRATASHSHSPSSPKTPITPASDSASSKRQKVSHPQTPSIPDSASVPAPTSASAAATDGHANPHFSTARGGETKWAFSFRAEKAAPVVEDSRKVNGNGAVGYRIEMLSPWVRESVVGMEEVADEGWNGAGTGQQPWRAEEGTGRKVFGSKGRWNGGANGVSLFICLGSHVGEINPGFLRVRGVNAASFPSSDEEEDVSEDDSDDSDGGEDNEGDGEEQATNTQGYSTADTAAVVSTQRKAQRKAERKAAAAIELARERQRQQQLQQQPKREVRLSKLTSISGTGGGGGGARKAANIECHQCGERGHRKAECPHKDQGLPY
ncbi:MAG: hypothetical protein LQ340_005071 [Diploschistes diacapsis]|nr:MAG: hypothetical protein LQ340_005071 [Diploschistes diacapsis]